MGECWGGLKKLMGLWLRLNIEYPGQERLVEKETGSLQLKCGGNWPQGGCGRVLYSGGDSWRQSCPLNPQQVPEGPTSPTVTSEIPPHQPGCTQDLWDLSGVLRSGPLPCPDGPGLPLSIPGEDNGPCCRSAALGHVFQRPSDPEQHYEEVPADTGTCLLTNEGLLGRALTLVSRQKLHIRGPCQGPGGKGNVLAFPLGSLTQKPGHS